MTYTLRGGLYAGQLMVSNIESNEEDVSLLNLRGWEARVYSL